MPPCDIWLPPSLCAALFCQFDRLSGEVRGTSSSSSLLGGLFSGKGKGKRDEDVSSPNDMEGGFGDKDDDDDGDGDTLTFGAPSDATVRKRHGCSCVALVCSEFIIFL